VIDDCFAPTLMCLGEKFFNMAKSKTSRKSKSNKQTKVVLVGKGDYQMTSENHNALMSKLDKLDKKIPNVSGALSSGVKALAPKAGAFLGSLVGGAPGALAGSKLGSKVSSLLGFGDYKISANSLIPGLQNMEAAIVPKFATGNNSVRIRERECLGDIFSASQANTFNLQSFPLNPANPSTFPWLSNIAPLYEQWWPHGIVFEFVSTSSEFNGTSQALGTVVMATNYNAIEPLFTSKLVMENEDYSNSMRSSCNGTHGIECDPKQRPLELMYVGYNTTTPVQFSSLGNFQLATTGVNNASVLLGELWISYDISFYKKSIINSFVTTTWYGITGSTSPSGPLIGSPVVQTGSSTLFSFLPIVGTGTNVYFPATQTSGKYIIVYEAPTLAYTTFNSTQYGLTSVFRTSGNVSGTQLVVVVLVTLNSTNAFFQFGDNGGSVTSNYNMSISSVPSTYVI